jgi:hypothetical protein
LVVLVRVLRRFSLAVVLALAAGYLIPTGAGLAFAAEPPGVLPPAVSPVTCPGFRGVFLFGDIMPLLGW